MAPVKAIRVGLLSMSAVAIATAGAYGQVSSPSHPASTAGASSSAAPTGSDPMAAGRELFGTWSCGSCHVLADAGGAGNVGPSLDGDPNVTKALVIQRVTNGKGAMPSYAGQMTDEEIAVLADYVSKSKR